jgi:hypothetical protein
MKKSLNKARDGALDKSSTYSRSRGKIINQAERKKL